MTWFFGLAAKVQQAIIIALLAALALSILVGGGMTLYYRAEAAEAREKLTRCAGDLAVEKANVEGLKGAIVVQNKAVQAIKDEADKRVRASEEARARAAAAAEKHRKTAIGLLEAKPADPNDLCASALAIYRGRRP